MTRAEGGVANSAGGLSEVGHSVVGETKDERVEAELVLQLEGAAEATLAGTIGGEIDQQFLSAL